MTEISLAGGRWHSVKLPFVRLVKGLHQQTFEGLRAQANIHCNHTLHIGNKRGEWR